MIKILCESTYLIRVNKDQELLRTAISQALNRARNSMKYVKFYSNKYYIIVTFQRDGTVLISSNYRTDLMFNKRLKELEQYKFGLYTTTYFIWYWMNKIRKK